MFNLDDIFPRRRAQLAYVSAATVQRMILRHGVTIWADAAVLRRYIVFCSVMP